MNLSPHLLSLGNLARGNNGNPVYFEKPVKKIIIHWIGPYPNQTPSIVRNWWEKGPEGVGVSASAHFIVKGEEVLQTLPINEVGWHSGDSRNFESIGIEVIPMNTIGEFAEDTIQTLREIIEHIQKSYPSAVLERHYDGIQKKNCPNFYTPYEQGGDERWEKLRKFLDGIGGV